MAKPATTVTPSNGKVTNPAKIEWPHDRHGITSMLRKEGLRAIGRIDGDETSLESVINTLRTLGEHARVRHADQIEARKLALKYHEEQRVAEEERRKRDQAADVVRLQGIVASAQAALAAAIGEPEDDADGE